MVDCLLLGALISAAEPRDVVAVVAFAVDAFALPAAFFPRWHSVSPIADAHVPASVPASVDLSLLSRTASPVVFELSALL